MGNEILPETLAGSCGKLWLTVLQTKRPLITKNVINRTFFLYFYIQVDWSFGAFFEMGYITLELSFND